MNTKLLALVLALLVQYSTAHVYLSSVNGNDEFDAIRPERPNGDRNAPITNVLADDMTCGWLPYASQPANRALPVTAGSNVTLQFYHDGPSPSDVIVESSHRGPCIIYMAENNGQQSLSWFKIWEYGLDASNKFCVDYLIKNGLSGAGKGKLTVKVPTYLPTGKYLMRAEIIALHQGDVIGGAQFYVNCIELSVTNAASSSTVSLSTIPTVKFPGAYSSTDPGIYYNLYQASLPPYTVPGPSVFVARSSSSPSPSSSAPSTPAPVSTTIPVKTAPTTTPTNTGKSIKIQIHPSSSTYWVAIAILDAAETISLVEFQGSGTFKKGWSSLTKTDYGYWVFGSGTVTLPLSLRLTSSSGKVLELDDIVSTQVGGTIISTNVQYGSTSSPATIAPSPSPATIAPTPSPATIAPSPSPATIAPTQATLKIDVHSGSSQWWFAVAFTGTTQTITSVELKDSNPNNQEYAAMTKQEWGYWVYHGAQLTPPLSLQIRSATGASLIVGRIPATEAVIDSDTSF